MPILFHNGQLADPLCEWTKRLKLITDKRKKTEEDYLEMAHLEWFGGMYTKNKKPCIPGYVMEGALVSGAKKKRMGTQAKSGIFVDKDSLLEFDGWESLTLDDLWENKDFRLTQGVKIQKARIMRTRPKFDEWAVEFVITYDAEVLSEPDVKDIVETTGHHCGLCDWRPRYGRFRVESCVSLD